MKISENTVIQRIDQKREDLRYSLQNFANLIGMTKNGYQGIVKRQDVKLSIYLKYVMC